MSSLEKKICRLATDLIFYLEECSNDELVETIVEAVLNGDSNPILNLEEEYEE